MYWDSTRYYQVRSGVSLQHFIAVIDIAFSHQVLVATQSRGALMDVMPEQVVLGQGADQLGLGQFCGQTHEVGQQEEIDDEAHNDPHWVDVPCDYFIDETKHGPEQPQKCMTADPEVLHNQFITLFMDWLPSN